MISKAQDMNNNIFIVLGDLNNYFNVFLRFYFKKKMKIQKISKIQFSTPCSKSVKKQRQRRPKLTLQHFFPKTYFPHTFRVFIFPFVFIGSFFFFKQIFSICLYDFCLGSHAGIILFYCICYPDLSYPHESSAYVAIRGQGNDDNPSAMILLMPGHALARMDQHEPESTSEGSQRASLMLGDPQVEKREPKLLTNGMEATWSQHGIKIIKKHSQNSQPYH